MLFRSYIKKENNKKKDEEERHHHPTQAQNQKISSASSIFPSADTPPLTARPRPTPSQRESHHTESTRPHKVSSCFTPLKGASHPLRPLGSLSMGFFPTPPQAASSASPRAVSSLTVTIWDPRARGTANRRSCAHKLQPLTLVCREPVLHHKRGHPNERPVSCDGEQLPRSATREGLQVTALPRHSPASLTIHAYHIPF